MRSVLLLLMQAKKKRTNIHRKKCFVDRLAELNAGQEQPGEKCGDCPSESALLVNTINAELPADEQLPENVRVNNAQLTADQCMDLGHVTNERRATCNSDAYSDSDQIRSSFEASDGVSKQFDITGEASSSCRNPVSIKSASVEYDVACATYRTSTLMNSELWLV
jgi:hypothetical protein